MLHRISTDSIRHQRDLSFSFPLAYVHRRWILINYAHVWYLHMVAVLSWWISDVCGVMNYHMKYKKETSKRENEKESVEKKNDVSLLKSTWRKRTTEEREMNLISSLLYVPWNYIAFTAVKNIQFIWWTSLSGEFQWIFSSSNRIRSLRILNFEVRKCRM